MLEKPNEKRQMKGLIIALFLLSIKPLLALSSTNPWVLDININFKSGTTIAQALANLKKDANEEYVQLVKGDKYHLEGTISFEKGTVDWDSIKSKEDKIYSGPCGEVLGRLLSDYGCGFHLQEIDNGVTYHIAVKMLNPDDKFSTFFTLSDESRKMVTHGGINKLFEATELQSNWFDPIWLSADGKAVFVSGRIEHCNKLKALHGKNTDQ